MFLIPFYLVFLTVLRSVFNAIYLADLSENVHLGSLIVFLLHFARIPPNYGPQRESFAIKGKCTYLASVCVHKRQKG